LTFIFPKQQDNIMQERHVLVTVQFIYL